mmetsp:Transcript_22949/g.34486  ORF Transcript_22949/g.34486 Transcript_22949/m.34486 type:complete len:116 (+) Transcript_22949:851-1198(+)
MRRILVWSRQMPCRTGGRHSFSTETHSPGYGKGSTSMSTFFLLHFFPSVLPAESLVDSPIFLSMWGALSLWVSPESIHPSIHPHLCIFFLMVNEFTNVQNMHNVLKGRIPVLGCS